MFLIMLSMYHATDFIWMYFISIECGNDINVPNNNNQSKVNNQLNIRYVSYLFLATSTVSRLVLNCVSSNITTMIDIVRSVHSLHFVFK